MKDFLKNFVPSFLEGIGVGMVASGVFLFFTRLF